MLEPRARRLVRTVAVWAQLAVCVHAFANPWEALPPAFDQQAICVAGPVGDATCDSEAVERANSEQLHSILQSLTDETFFRLWRVNLHGVCPFERFSAVETSTCAAPPPVESEPEPAHTFFGGALLQLSSGLVSAATGQSSCSVEPHPELAYEDEPEPIDDATDLVDTTISRAEGVAAGGTVAAEAACDDEEMPEFWLDMCSRIPTMSGQVVNLRLNPESDTGYNGSHIWAAMYQENCFVRASQPASMCLEERVLYRLLSGMHASTNIHIAMHLNATASLHADADALFAKHFGTSERSERLRDLHFAFVVLLRAVQKGSEFIRNFPYAQAAPGGGGERTGALVNRLLDSCILQSCASVFSAFDEAMLFQKPHEHTWWSLKRQFKGVFQNISSIVDCIPCQKCRMHGKLQLLGLGTALKWLLLPADLIHTTTSREELVALVNTLGKFSRAISWSRALALRAQARTQAQARTCDAPPAPATPSADGADDGSALLLRDAIKLIAEAARERRVDGAQEATLLRLALSGDPAMVSLVRHYGPDVARHFALLADHAARESAGLSRSL